MRKLFLTFAWLIASPQPVFAGMSYPRLSDIASARVESLSFFLAVFLVSGFLLKWVWNYLRNDFVSLPRLTYSRSLGLITVWGALFVLVLTMISGARELLTPGAWDRVGTSYQLKEANKSNAAEPPPEFVRRAYMERLREALTAYAASHSGELPKDIDGNEIARDVWRSPDPLVPYAYVKGCRWARGNTLVSFEPRLYANDHFALLTNGEIRRMNDAELDAALLKGGKP